MQNKFRSPWLAVLIGIAGLTVGYTIVIMKENPTFLVNVQCPAQEVCLKGSCGEGCNCKEDCVGNCEMKEQV